MCPFQWKYGGKSGAVEEPLRCVDEKVRNNKQEKGKEKQRNSSLSFGELKIHQVANTGSRWGSGFIPSAHRDDSARCSVKTFQILVKFSLVPLSSFNCSVRALSIFC